LNGNFSFLFSFSAALTNNDTTQDHRFKSLLATPMVTSFPQLYILGMSNRSAKLAAQRGLPFVIARMGQSETDLHEAISTYRKYFKAYHGEINSAVSIDG
jgi:alkanesulfonate monooxygenase SsuD/methylene tetrahydromethanopterin reductase-like flavin-dependent oxidoreductase (luciferase family)